MKQNNLKYYQVFILYNIIFSLQLQIFEVQKSTQTAFTIITFPDQCDTPFRFHNQSQIMCLMGSQIYKKLYFVFMNLRIVIIISFSKDSITLLVRLFYHFSCLVPLQSIIYTSQHYQTGNFRNQIHQKINLPLSLFFLKQIFKKRIISLQDIILKCGFDCFLKNLQLLQILHKKLIYVEQHFNGKKQDIPYLNEKVKQFNQIKFQRYMKKRAVKTKYFIKNYENKTKQKISLKVQLKASQMRKNQKENLIKKQHQNYRKNNKRFLIKRQQIAEIGNLSNNLIFRSALIKYYFSFVFIQKILSVEFIKIF
ncbi:transmembrane protein, putative (macronuclear) [Tetrahymena thermophila SB210]|uniref:Transmembrane protein, putative n=1 Tax=Tetrahymena thermophila (strain SB210) TaxID=312017 RepID=W7X9N4_TETTS|nr:transmembrane protein, putative [Tetrahymena thermophila SB210]EWS73113.1 transmembrane protein, putative [Tetrahymena thermophila SB210]|eukprot:XP_012654300.1 transmembrane protein, putative [Tetrahymena thermophila SB210]